MRTRFHNAELRALRCRGFTVIEVMLVGALMSLLAVLVAGAWAGLGRLTANTTFRCRVVQEANLAAESLAYDLGGHLPGETAGNKQHGAVVGRFVAAGSQLWLCFDGDDDEVADWGSPDTVIVYELQDSRLIRRNLQDGSDFTVAANVDHIQLVDLGDGIRLELTFAYRDISRTYTLYTKDP